MVSGLYIGSAHASHIELALLQEFLLGQVGCNREKDLAASIGHLIILGGLHMESSELEEDDLASKRRRFGPSSGREFAHKLGAARAADCADLFLAPIAFSGINITILPGDGDTGVPSRLPQPPLPMALF